MYVTIIKAKLFFVDDKKKTNFCKVLDFVLCTDN